jgi:hypothetical protein
MPLEIISVHFPKAGGTSLAACLRASFGEHLALDYDHDPVHPNYALSEPSNLAPNIRAVHGHFRGDRYTGPAFRMTFLREPVSNLISIYLFWRTYPEGAAQLHRRFLAERPSVLAFAQYPAIQTLMSETYFGGVDLDRFDFIGFHERRREDLGRLSHVLGLELDGDLHLNKTTRTTGQEQDLLSDAPLLAALRDHLSKDVALYERLFNRRA